MAIDLKELSNLIRRPDGFFDLTLPFINESAIAQNQFICTKRHDGRMDLVSFDIYGTAEYKMLLCGVNNFLNEFSVKEGDVLFYPNLDSIDNVRATSGEIRDDDRNALIDAMKKAAIDPARNKYLRERSTKESLPTVIQPPGREQINYSGNKIKLSPGFGTDTGSNQTSPQTTPTVQPPDNNNAASRERILVRRFFTK